MCSERGTRDRGGTSSKLKREAVGSGCGGSAPVPGPGQGQGPGGGDTCGGAAHPGAGSAQLRGPGSLQVGWRGTGTGTGDSAVYFGGGRRQSCEVCPCELLALCF